MLFLVSLNWHLPIFWLRRFLVSLSCKHIGILTQTFKIVVSLNLIFFQHCFPFYWGKKCLRVCKNMCFSDIIVCILFECLWTYINLYSHLKIFICTELSFVKYNYRNFLKYNSNPVFYLIRYKFRNLLPSLKKRQKNLNISNL